MCLVIDDDDDAVVTDVDRLAPLADRLVLVESTSSGAGLLESIVRRRWPDLRSHAGKLRHVVAKPRSLFARGADALDGLGRALMDVEPTDIVVIATQRLLLDESTISAIRGIGATPLRLTDQKPVGVAFRGAMLASATPQAVHRAEIARTQGGSDLPVGLRPARGRAAVPGRRLQGKHRPDPVIICCHVDDADREIASAAFGLGERSGARLPVVFWKDTERIGPERSFQACWEQHPDRDVVIIHPDMRPMPGDRRNRWYDDLLGHVRTLPQAGIVGCDLLLPQRIPGRRWHLESGGGYFDGTDIKVVGGPGVEYRNRMKVAREVSWATFGGVYIRREVIDLVGRFDPAYQWAYVMDVDYCMEARLRGYAVYQVPVNLIHDSNGSTRPLLEQAEYQDKITANRAYFARKWRRLLIPDA